MIGAPRNTPTEIVDKLNNEINAALADPNMKARLADLGGTARWRLTMARGFGGDAEAFDDLRVGELFDRHD
jgi:hypothetical protein